MVLSAGRDLTLDREMSQEGIDVVIIHFVRMSPAPALIAMESKKSFDPLNVCFFGPNRKVLDAATIADLVDYPRRADRTRGIVASRVHDHPPRRKMAHVSGLHIDPSEYTKQNS